MKKLIFILMFVGSVCYAGAALEVLSIPTALTIIGITGGILFVRLFQLNIMD